MRTLVKEFNMNPDVVDMVSSVRMFARLCKLHCLVTSMVFRVSVLSATQMLCEHASVSFIVPCL